MSVNDNFYPSTRPKRLSPPNQVIVNSQLSHSLSQFYPRNIIKGSLDIHKECTSNLFLAPSFMLSTIIDAASIAYLLLRALVWPICSFRCVSQNCESSFAIIYSFNQFSHTLQTAINHPIGFCRIGTCLAYFLFLKRKNITFVTLQFIRACSFSPLFRGIFILRCKPRSRFFSSRRRREKKGKEEKKNLPLSNCLINAAFKRKKKSKRSKLRSHALLTLSQPLVFLNSGFPSIN